MRITKALLVVTSGLMLITLPALAQTAPGAIKAPEAVKAPETVKAMEATEAAKAIGKTTEAGKGAVTGKATEAGKAVEAAKTFGKASEAEKAAKTASPLEAGKAATKAKKRSAKTQNASAVTVVNARTEDILTVTAQSAAGKAVPLLKKPLTPGKKQSVKLPAGSGCDFSVTASFADGSEFEPTPVNLCRDKTIRFTEGETQSEAATPAEE